MQRQRSTWPRRRHGKLRQLGDNLWFVQGPVPGMLYQRQMVVARDERGRLLLHSAIALEPPGMAELETLGTPTWLVVPNGYHRLDAPAYKRRYPDIAVVAPRGSVRRIQAVVPVDLTYEEFPVGDAFSLESAPGSGAKEGVVQVRSREGTTLVFNDLLWTPPSGGWSEVFFRWLKQGPQVSLLAKQMLVNDASALRTWLLGLAQTERLVRLVPGHGAPVERDASEVLRNIAARV